MTVDAIVGRMTKAEKLLAMELIWRDLSASPGEFESPSWHGEIIAERLERSDSSSGIEWETAKADLLKAAHDH